MQEHNSKTSEPRHRNRLIFEKSPYLLQHAANPVDWYPWGEEAFAKARKENKPIFLSIGYSTCHWCHVMAHESFEDSEVAQLLNEAFVCIKVDREERPDLDNIYLQVCHLLTGSGGWPLTIVMTADKKPFFATTYIPKGNRFGRMGMLDLIPRIKEVWISRQDEILHSANQITTALNEAARENDGEELGAETLHRTFHQLEQRFDEEYGGFSRAPKFPTPHNLLFLLRYWHRTRNEGALAMVEKTLQKMRCGGIYDHIGFGFHRYSTDREWLVPHFEKMLYDQALIALAYTEAFQATGHDEYAQTVHEMLSYVLRDMAHPDGGFYSGEDADSEGVEGRFYVWTDEEIGRLLTPEEAEIIIKTCNIKKPGNFRDEASRQPAGTNILHVTRPLPEIARALKISEKEFKKQLAGAKQKLFSVRAKRVHPHKDDKILTDWNGLMIAALAKAAQVFDMPRYADTAARAATFILNTLRTPEGRLLHRFRDGEAAIKAMVDDYAFFVWGLLELYEATLDVQYLQTALDVTNDMLSHFWDESSGGVYFTADDAEELLVRRKEIYDGAIPSGNSVAMLNLVRLGRITARTDFEHRAQQIMRTFSTSVREAPSAYTHLMAALDFALGPSFEIVIAGNSHAQDTKKMLRAARTVFAPNKIVLLRPTETESPDIAAIAPYTRSQVSIDGKATAYVCQNYTCSAPTTDAAKMFELLNVRK